MIDVELAVMSVPRVDAWSGEIESAIEGAMPAVAEVLREAADSCFETQSDPWGNAWEPTRRSAAGEGRILIDRGILRGSLAPSPTSPTPGVVTARVSAGGAAAAYAGVHQWGGAHVDARPFLALRGGPDAPTVDLPPVVYAEVVATIQDAMDAAVQRANAER